MRWLTGTSSIPTAAQEFTMPNHTQNYALDYESPEIRTAASGSRRPASFGIDDVKSYLEPVEEFVLKYPGAALASAFFVGVLVAWWIKRK
jgi:hypothetical protein